MSFSTDVGIADWMAKLEGDLDPTTGEPPEDGASGIVYQSAVTIWDRWSAKGPVWPGLQELYARRDCLDLLLSVVQDETSIALGQGALTEGLGDKFKHLQERRADRQKEIERLELAARARRGPATAAMSTTAPISPPVFPPIYPYGPDANAPYYSGSPYLPRRYGP